MSDAYVLSEDQEIWADDMDYRADSDDVVLRRNIQILDEGQKVLAFGDYGRYWGRCGDAMLTEDPSVISFYEQGDSLYMRSDSIFMYVIDSTSIYSADYIGNKVEEKPVDTGEELITGASTEQPLSVSDEAEDMASSEEEATEGRDGLAGGDVLPDEEIARDGEVPETGVSEEVSATGGRYGRYGTVCGTGWSDGNGRSGDFGNGRRCDGNGNGRCSVGRGDCFGRAGADQATASTGTS